MGARARISSLCRIFTYLEGLLFLNFGALSSSEWAALEDNLTMSLYWIRSYLCLGVPSTIGMNSNPGQRFY